MKTFTIIASILLLVIGLLIQAIPSIMENGIESAIGSVFLILSVLVFSYSSISELEERVDKLEREINKKRNNIS